MYSISLSRSTLIVFVSLISFFVRQIEAMMWKKREETPNNDLSPFYFYFLFSFWLAGSLKRNTAGEGVRIRRLLTLVGRQTAAQQLNASCCLRLFVSLFLYSHPVQHQLSFPFPCKETSCTPGISMDGTVSSYLKVLVISLRSSGNVKTTEPRLNDYTTVLYCIIITIDCFAFRSCAPF